MKFNEDQIDDIVNIVGVILHLSNLKFATAGGAQVANMDLLTQVRGGRLD